MNQAHGIQVRISAGELADRLTILRLKAERIADPEKRSHVLVELTSVEAAYRRHVPNSTELDHVFDELAVMNERLWNAEDAVRACELRQDFGPAFIGLARSIYQSNDRRSALKSRINHLAGSDVFECKSYASCSCAELPPQGLSKAR